MVEAVGRMIAWLRVRELSDCVVYCVLVLEQELERAFTRESVQSSDRTRTAAGFDADAWFARELSVDVENSPEEVIESGSVDSV